MTPFKQLIAATLIAASSVTTLTPIAMADDVNPGDFTIENIPVSDPFGALPVNQEAMSWEAFNALIANLSASQEQELVQRCAVVGIQPGHYGQTASAFCGNLYLALGLLDEEDEDDDA